MQVLEKVRSSVVLVNVYSFIVIVVVFSKDSTFCYISNLVTVAVYTPYNYCFILRFHRVASCYGYML